MNERVSQFIKNPEKSLIKLSLPIIIAMIVQTMYNIVDTAFVGRLGEQAIAALTFSFPVFFILISLNAGLGAGMNSKISRSIGNKKIKLAENTSMHGLLISFILALIAFLVGSLSLNFLFSILGAEPSVIILAKQYMSVILIATFVIFPSFAMNSILSAQGNTKTPMKIQITTLVINMILDPIFIYYLKLGVRGAAIATLIAFSIGFVIYIYFIRKKSYLKIKLSSFKFSINIIKDIFKIGIPASIMLLLMSFYYGFISRFMSFYGTKYVAAFGILSRLQSVIMMPLIALALGVLTLTGMFYGANRTDLIKRIAFYSMKISLMSIFALGFIFFIFPGFFLRIFTIDNSLIAIAIPYLRINLFILPFMAISLILSRSMQGMGYGMPGLVINFIRVVGFAVPLGYLVVYVFSWNYLFVPVTAIIGGIVANIVAFPWFFSKLKKKSKSV